MLDTNVIASLSAMNGAPSVKAWAALQPESVLYLSILTLAEYDKGVHQLADEDPARARYQARRHALAARFSGRILPVTNKVVERWEPLARPHQAEHGPTAFSR